MKTTALKSKNIIITCIFTCLIGAFLLSFKVDSSTSTRNFDSVTLFRGVFFAEGQVAQRIPELDVYKSSVRGNTLSINNQRNTIINKIKKDHPDFLNRFKTNIQSGNHLLIKTSLDEGHALLQSYTTFNKRHVQADENIDIAVEKIVLDIPALMMFQVISGPPSTNKLRNDILVNQIAINLKSLN